MSILSKNVINFKCTVKEALRVLNDIGIYRNVLFIVDDENKLIGTLTDGDIRRALLRDVETTTNVVEAVNKDFRYIISNRDYSTQIKNYKGEGIRFVPLLDEANRLISILDLQDFSGFLPVNVVIMAGGRGQRLMPLTATVPKPMLKVGMKPIIEHNIDRLAKFGVQNFHISINYLGTIISSYFNDGSDKGITIRYITETKPLGTLGSLTLVDKYEKDYILLMNSDLLTDINFEDFFNTFIDMEADMAVAAVPYHVDVPYAVLETAADNKVLSLKEKPRYTYFSNAGIYLFKKSLLQTVPKDVFYNTTDLMEYVIAQDMKLITYPVLGYWLDIGRMNDYLKAQEDIKHLKI